MVKIVRRDYNAVFTIKHVESTDLGKYLNCKIGHPWYLPKKHSFFPCEDGEYYLWQGEWKKNE